MFVLSGCKKKYSNDAWNLSLADSPELEAYIIARYDFRQSLAGFERYLNRSAPMLPTLIKRPFILPESWELSITTEHFISSQNKPDIKTSDAYGVIKNHICLSRKIG